MPNIKHCRDGCKWGSDRMRRIYIRDNKPIIKEATEYPYKDKTLGYKRQFKAIGWMCLNCNTIEMDDQEKHIPFKKYHKLEFDYNQLLNNIERNCMEEK